MPGALVHAFRAIAVAGTAGLLIGCASVAPGASPAASVAPTFSVAPSATPIVSDAPATAVIPSAAPVKTPKPPKSPKASQPGATAAANGTNLVITKFVSASDPIVSGIHADGRVTVKNTGGADAGRFDIGVSYTQDDGLGFGGNSAVPVDGLAAGESVQVTVNLSLETTAPVTFLATADSGGVVDESDEDDNTLALQATAIAQTNIAFYGDPFFVKHIDGESGYRMAFNYENAGQTTITDVFKISVAWSKFGTSGTFPEEDCCSTMAGMQWGPGTASQSQYGPYNFPESGTYTVVVTLDSTNVIAETNEDDNVQTATAQIP